MPPGHGVAETFLSACSWAVQHEDNFSSKGSVRRITSKLACLCPDLKRPRTYHLARHVHQSSLINASGPSSLDSVATGGDPHGTKCMAARTHGRGYSDINGRPHSMSKVVLHLAVINFIRKLQVRLLVSEVAGPRASTLEVEQWRLARKIPGASSTPQSQGRVVSDNTCRPSFLAIQTLRLLGSKRDHGTASCCPTGMA